MGEVLSIFAIAVLLVLIVVSLRRQRARAASDEAQARTRIGYDEAQHERSVQRRADSRATPPE